jgi:tetratricopeptide (TPR) repeat protein
LAAMLILTACIVRSRHRPAIAGWFWFVVLLLPMLAAARYRTAWVADRYALVPHMLFMAAIAAVFFDATAAAQQRTGNSTFLRRWGAVSIVLAILVLLSVQQVWRWQNTETLFRHALTIVPDSAASHHALGQTLMEQGRLAEAGDHFAHAVAIVPTYADSRVNLGIVAERLGNFPLAEQSLRAALELRPTHRAARFAMAKLRARQGRHKEAVALYEQLARDYPDALDVRVNYGAALEMMGDRAGAEAQYREALRLDPGDPDARANLEDLLSGRSPAHPSTTPSPGAE